MMLCERCENFNIQVFSKDGFMYRGYPLEAVLDSVDKGCFFCSILLEHLRLADGGNEYTYLGMAMRKRKQEKLSVSRSSLEQMRLIRIWLEMVALPVWVHFRVLRGRDATNGGEEPLNIKQLGVFVSGTRWTRMMNATSSYTPMVWFNVAADPGEAISAWERLLPTNIMPVQ